MRIVLLAAVLLAQVVPAQAEDPTALSLESAVERAVAHSPEIAAARARLDIAQADEGLAGARRRPRLQLSSSLSRSTDPARVFGDLLAQEAFGPENFEIDRLNNPDPLTHSRNAVVVEQPLFTAGRTRHSVAAARSARGAADAELERVRHEIVHRTFIDYASLIVADAEVEAVGRALEAAEANLRLVVDREQAGLALRADRLRAEVRVGELEERRVAAEASRDVARTRMNLRLGWPAGRALWVSPDVGPVEAPVDIEGLVEAARLRRPDLQATANRTEAARRTAAAARAELRPELAASGRFETGADRPFGLDGTHWTVAVGLRIPLWEPAERSRLARRRAQWDEARRLQESLDDRVELEIRAAWHGLLSAIERRKRAEASVALAAESLRVVRDRYEQGMATVVELLETESIGSDAEARATAARGEAFVAAATLELAAGRL